MVYASILDVQLQDYEIHCRKSALFKNHVRNINDGNNRLISDYGGDTKMTDEKKEVGKEQTEKQEENKDGKVRPCKKFVAFPVTASIWKNKKEIEGENRVFYSVSLQKCYKDGEEWKNTTSLNPMDLPKSILVLQESFKYIAMLGKEGIDKKEE